jgi:hypothetical protein
VKSRLRAALTALAVLLATVGIAAPAQAAGFTGSAVITSAGSVPHGSATARMEVDFSGLSPDVTRLDFDGNVVDQQPVAGGAITRRVTGGITWSIDPATQTGYVEISLSDSDGGIYLFPQLGLAGPGGETYVVPGQIRVDAGTLTAAGPTIPASGTARVGQTLTVDAGTSFWTPAATGMSVAWHDVNGGALLGTGSTYTLTPADQGRVLDAEATATRAGYNPSTVASTWFGAVGPGLLTVDQSPTIGGLRVGVPTTATAATFTPTPDSVTYQWHLGDGTPIAGATSATFTPGPEHVGATPYLVATAHRAGYEDLAAQSNVPGAVARAEVTVDQAPTLPTTARIGTPLTVTTPTFTPAPDTITYQWYRTPGTAIPGATGTTYTPTVADAGSQLYVVLSATGAATEPFQVQSTMTGAVALRTFTSTPTPTVSGLGLLGTLLGVDVHADDWAPAATSFTYQWYRSSGSTTLGTAVPGATAATYAPTAADGGSWFYVEVTAHAAGYSSYVIGSAPTRTVVLPWGTPTDGTSQVETTQGGRLRVTLHGLVPGVAHEVELHSDPVALGTVVPAADGTAVLDVALPAGVPAGAHNLVVLRDGVEVLRVPVTVAAAVAAAAPAASPALAVTGSDAAVQTGAAGLLMLLGAVLVTVTRRRRGARP